jgi:hypothetical protein
MTKLTANELCLKFEYRSDNQVQIWDRKVCSAQRYDCLVGCKAV